MNKMQFAGTINSEETVSGLLPDGRRIYAQILSIYPMPTVEQGLDPLYWLGRLEAGDFEDEENPPIVWVEPARAEQETPEDIAQGYLDKYHAEQDMQALDDDIEAKMQRKIDSQADQDYYAQCAAEGYDPHGHDRNCDCPECCGDEPEPISGPAWVWPCNLCGNLQERNVNWEGIPANCERCFSYVCNEHGGVDAEGNIWCEKCAKEQNVVLEEDPVPGWPPTAQETVHYQEVMAKPDEF